MYSNGLQFSDRFKIEILSYVYYMTEKVHLSN